MQRTRLSIVMEFVVWLTCALPAVVWNGPDPMAGTALFVWVAAFGCFGAALAADAFLHSRVNGRYSGDRVLLLAMTLAAFILILAASGMAKYMSALVLALVARRLAYTMPERAAWFAAVAIALVTAALYAIDDGWTGALVGGGALAALLTFALSHSLHELRERAARAELLARNAELHATRELLAESSRVAERLRISRDLHDTLGHHLTALSIQLDIATRRSEGPAAEHIREAHAITRLLLSDVRNVVGQLRVTGGRQLVEELRRMATGSQDLAIHLDVPEQLAVDDDARADSLLRCVQEIVTNTRKHAHASNLWIRIATDDNGFEVNAHDDGNGTDRYTPGHGLIGMRERFAQHGGRVNVTARSEGGFIVHAFLPQRQGAS